MGWMHRLGCWGVLGIPGVVGCASIPPLDNPALIRPGDSDPENPVLVSPGQPTPEAYDEIYTRVLDALDDYFDVKPSSRYSGIIETMPKVAPGFEQPWKPGSPSRYERLHATFQSIRHTAKATITAGDRGGYRVYIEVFKEIEVLRMPAVATSSTSIFRDSSGADRRAELVVGPRSPEPQWVPAGSTPHRDFALEQQILRKIQRSGGLK